MTAGMATVSGSVMIALAGELENQFVGINIVQHFLTASILSIPAAIMYAEIMYPSNEITHQISDAKEENIYAGSMDAITKGTKDGLNIAVNVAAILIAILALVSIVDGFLSLMCLIYPAKDIRLDLCPMHGLWVTMGEAASAAELLGLKLATNEFVAYINWGA
ncbi:MAG: hypothetical protein CM15mP19_08480 [Gammaproteobacteria bacterium]|nr:MAG: hypothetical protein CM15mP19_08480 [Gammaproteobacteria bacterium]